MANQKPGVNQQVSDILLFCQVFLFCVHQHRSRERERAREREREREGEGGGRPTIFYVHFKIFTQEFQHFVNNILFFFM
jgi:hypothetical protein